MVQCLGLEELSDRIGRKYEEISRSQGWSMKYVFQQGENLKICFGNVLQGWEVWSVLNYKMWLYDSGFYWREVVKRSLVHLFSVNENKEACLCYVKLFNEK